MTKCTSKATRLAGCKGRKIELRFDGGEVASAGGVVVLREIDRRLGLIRDAVSCLPDPRNKDRVRHTHEQMLRQRLYALALGCEDINDNSALSDDPCFQTAVGKDCSLASPATLCRFENRADRDMAWIIHDVLCGSSSPPTSLLEKSFLDFFNLGLTKVNFAKPHGLLAI
jgi:hypothetical protein